MSQLAAALQSHGQMLSLRGLVVSPGALISVGDVEADYQPPGSAVSYARLNIEQTKTDPFTGRGRKGKEGGLVEDWG